MKIHLEIFTWRQMMGKHGETGMGIFATFHGENTQQNTATTTLLF